MRKLIAGTAVSVVALGGWLVGPAGAVDDSAPHGDSGHCHYVTTGNGEQQSVGGPNNRWEGGARGMHRAGNEAEPIHHTGCPG